MSQPASGKLTIECSALLSHVQMLESRLIDKRRSKDEERFGHPPSPQLHMCRIPDPDRPGTDFPVTAVLAITRRCASAQLLKESGDSATVGPPVEVLVMSGEDQVNCATLIALERGQLSADDAKVVPDEHSEDGVTLNNQHSYDNGNPSNAVSLMSGGIVPVAPAPRIAVVIGTTHSRLISIEFSIMAKSMALIRRNHVIGSEVLAYFEPLPKHSLTDHQKIQQRMPGGMGNGSHYLSEESESTAESLAQMSLSYKRGKRIVPLTPTGGVTNIKAYTSIRKNDPNSASSLSSSLRDQKKWRERTHLWISYGDGTAVRLHHAGLFPSVIQKHYEANEYAKHLESALVDSVLRFQIRLPPLVDTEVTMIPLPKYHPSPLAPFPRLKQPEFHDDDDMVLGETLAKTEYQEDTPDLYEAIVYCKGTMADSFPMIAFYTSEDQESNLVQGGNNDVDANIASNIPIVNNVLDTVWGGLMGILGAGNSDEVEKQNKNEEVKEINWELLKQPPQWDPKIPFASMNYEATYLYAGCEIHDPPRQVTHCTIDPDGDLAAVSDTLGRVSLIDLSTKQIIRMWKGYRDTECHWIQVARSKSSQGSQSSSARTKLLYVVIHSRQRKVVEIWRTRQGPRVKTMQVGRDAQIVSCRELTSIGYVWKCFLAHSTVPFSKLNQLERIVFNEEGGSTVFNQPNIRSPSGRQDGIQLSQEAAAKLNRLQQLLGDTNVPCQGIDVFRALENIKSLKDLATALDLLAVAPALEEKMQVHGAEFQRLAIGHCKDKLDDAVKKGGKESLKNPNVQLLAFKISFYTQVASAYEILQKFEVGSSGDVNNEEDVQKLSSWSLESLGWTTTYEQISGKSIDDDLPNTPTEALKFYAFANACVPPRKWIDGPKEGDGGYRIHLSDSSKTRREVLGYIFKPLLGDVFALGSVNQVFEVLGIVNDYEYKAKCFAEWFIGLSIGAATEKKLLTVSSPMGRWLQDLVGSQLEARVANGRQEIALTSIYNFCRHSEELVRAFWLCALCREAVAAAATRMEEKTYGKISSSDSVSDWEQLLRQLRVCLLVSFRLFGKRLGPCPITVHSVDNESTFSILEWLAHDELAMSHKHDEIVSLENACRISSHSFDPTSPEADEPDRIKVIQHSCLAAALSEAERSEFLVDFDDDDRLGALLLYLRPFNMGELLVFHRSLILASKWGRDPRDLEILKDAIVAMKSMDVDKYKSIAAAVRLEVWQTNIRPVYRALLMGFDDVQEISADVVAPLFRDAAWVTSFGKLASEVLVLMSEFVMEAADVLNQFEGTTDGIKEGGSWPPVREDFILKRLVERSRPLNSESVDAHRVLICALLISKDIHTLSRCIPSFYDLFQPFAIFNPVAPLADADDEQHAFMQDAIVARAREYNGPSLDTLSLGVIDILAVLWDFDLKNVKTLFLLSMYELGKDRVVDELLTKSAPFISVKHFCQDGVDIACRRLNNMLHLHPNDEVRKVLGLLDADMCEWIRDRAEGSEPLVHGTLDVPVGNTHLFLLRLLSLAAVAEVSKEERIKIHSLIVLSGTVVKSLENTVH